LKDEDEEEESIDFSSQEKDLKNALSAQDEDETKPEDTSDSKSDSTEVDTLGSQDEVNPTELTPEEILESQDKIAAERDQEFIDLLLEDYYVHEAVNVLKALKIYNK
jgi:carboxyl-terminal processing protease